VAPRVPRLRKTVDHEHEGAATLLDDVDADTVGGHDVMAGSVHGRAVWLIGESLAASVYAV